MSRSAAEQEFWIKCERSTGNLASGMEKWLEEMIDEEGGAGRINPQHRKVTSSCMCTKR
ncbi:hypothetical protein HOO68_05800 [Candidatus Gracilibacteria bacterium]|nr:hypothetical protein [Candidatus Gracilibacteria bacterium]